MSTFVIDGQEIDLEGIEHDTVVICRPTSRLDSDAFKRFRNGANHLSAIFARHNCSLIFANFDQVTFEVLKAKQSEVASK